MTRVDASFEVDGTPCAAWVYRPDGADAGSTGPAIVLGHGLAGIKEMRLDAFAERFAAAGYLCLVFDYRHFGASGGHPRQLLDIGRQLADWRAAIAYARSLSGVDPDRVVAWGTSFGGGHAISIAAEDHGLAAAIAQCPFTDGLASTRALPLTTSARLTARALRDRLGALVGRAPVMVPSYGEPGTAALMTSPDSRSGVLALIPAGREVRSDVAARFALQIIRYFPGRATSGITCPILFCVSEHDSVAPARQTLKYAARAPHGEIALQPSGHFGIYVGADFEHNVADQLDFLRRHVPA